MSQIRRYPIARSLRHICAGLNLSPARVLARLGLPGDFLDNEGRGVDAATYLAMWDAVHAEAAEPDLALRMGQAACTGPLQPALLAISASPDIRTGLQRMALFKPLVAPMRLLLSEDAASFSVAFDPSEPGLRMSAFMQQFEPVFFLACARSFTATDVRPLEVQLPDPASVSPAYRAWINGPVVRGPMPRLTLSMRDALRPLISADTEFYALVERELMSRLEATATEDAMQERVRRALVEMLPSGMVSAEAVAEALVMSKRSLQRRLKAEGTSFQQVLDATRSQLALTYLRDQGLTAEETSYLLAYRDPNSFYRAFHDWTGMTPAQARVVETV